MAIALGLLAGPAVGVLAQEEELPAPRQPVAFTARFVPGPEVRAQTVEEVDGRREYRDVAWAPSVTASDPRLEGTLTFSADEDGYQGESGRFTVGHGTYRIENAEGAWQGSQLYLEASAPEFDEMVNSFHGPVVPPRGTWAPPSRSWAKRGGPPRPAHAQRSAYFRETPPRAYVPTGSTGADVRSMWVPVVTDHCPSHSEVASA